MAVKDWARKVHQVCWADWDPWVQQLYEDHRVRVRLELTLPAPGDGIKPGVVLVAYRVMGIKTVEEVHRDWRTFDPRDVGAVEKLGLEMASRLLLDLEEDKERAERQAPLPL